MGIVKKFIIFMCLFSLLRAESIYTRIAQDSANKVFKTQIEEPKEIKKYIKINLNIGLLTKHVKVENNHDYDFYEKNDIFSLELEKNKELVGMCKFINSYGNESLALYYGKVFDKNNKGFSFNVKTGIAKGYNKIDYLPSKTVKNMNWEFRNPNVLYRDYSLLATVGVGYSFNENVGMEINLIGNAIVTGVKLSY